MLDLFEQGQLPDEISYLFRIAETKDNHPFRNLYDEYEAHVESHDFDDDEQALSVCILQMEEDLKESLQKHYDSELVYELLTEIKAGKYDRHV